MNNKKLSDILFILWAGGATLLSYSLVYALRKPYTAAAFDGLDIWGVDYKVAVTIAQIIGYVLSTYRYQSDFLIEKRGAYEIYPQLYHYSRDFFDILRVAFHSL